MRNSRRQDHSEEIILQESKIASERTTRQTPEFNSDQDSNAVTWAASQLPCPNHMQQHTSTDLLLSIEVNQL